MMRFGEQLSEDGRFVVRRVNDLVKVIGKKNDSDMEERTRRYKSALKLSRQMEALGAKGKAIEYLNRAEGEGIMLADVYKRKARLYKSMGDEEKHIQSLEKALNADKNNLVIARQLGRHFMDAGSYYKAAEYFKLALMGDAAADKAIYEAISHCYKALELNDEAELFNKRAMNAAG